MRSGTTIAILSVVLAAAIAHAQSSQYPIENGNWRPRSYPDLQTIMQAGGPPPYSEPILAPPATWPAEQTARPVLASPDIPSLPPAFNPPQHFSQARTASAENPAPGEPSTPPAEFKPPRVQNQTTVPRQMAPPPPSEDSSGEQQTTQLPQMASENSPMNALCCDEMACDYDPYGAGYCGTNPYGQFDPFASGGVYAADNRVIRLGGLFFPLWQNSDKLVFADLRGQWDDHDSGEGNFGLGFRKFVDPQTIFGAYVYYDLLATTESNVFNQVTVGADILTLNWDFRVNGVWPGSKDKSSPNMSAINDGTIVTRNFRERAYQGWDAEIGNRFLHWGWNDCYAMYWFVGAYYYRHTSDGYPSFAGPRWRLEMRMFDVSWLGAQSRVDLGLEGSFDKVRNEQIAGFLRLRIPFGCRASHDILDPLRRRMVDLPVRDLY